MSRLEQPFIGHNEHYTLILFIKDRSFVFDSNKAFVTYFVNTRRE